MSSVLWQHCHVWWQFSIAAEEIPRARRALKPGSWTYFLAISKPLAKTERIYGASAHRKEQIRQRLSQFEMIDHLMNCFNVGLATRRCKYDRTFHVPANFNKIVLVIWYVANWIYIYIDNVSRSKIKAILCMECRNGAGFPGDLKKVLRSLLVFHEIWNKSKWKSHY